MKAVIQRVTRAEVTVGGDMVGRINRGLVVLVGVATGDTDKDAAYLAKKTLEMRIFEDASGKFNLSALDIGAEIMAVSQFTLLADTRKGNRPSFTAAAPPEEAAPLVATFCTALAEAGIDVQEGRFGAAMEVELVNDGPVTVVLDMEPASAAG